MAEWEVPGYTRLKALGSGGFGQVVLARHDASGTPVAIKYLRQNLLSDPEFAEMFRAEAAVLGSLEDPHVVRLYEYVEATDGAAIVMELVDGVSLREILKHLGATTPEAALVVLQGSLLGLAAAHQRGVVHRDYKPENVLVDADGASKLTDFGIAARSGDHPMPAGTVHYAPPEQFTGAPATPAADVYAATATCFECLAGQPPFRGDTVEALLHQHLSQPVPLEAVPEALRPLIAAGMAKNPADRPADGNAFVAALRVLAAGAYGPDWEQRGRSHLGEAALLLAALWPSRRPPADEGTTVERIPLRRRSRMIKTVIAASVVIVAAAAGTALAAASLNKPSAFANQTPVGTVSLQPSPTTSGPIAPSSPAASSSATSSASSSASASASASSSASSSSSSSAPAPPAVTGVAPSSGSTAGGTTVTITGTGLAGATGVSFGSAAGTIKADSATKITVTSPPGTGAVSVTVTTPHGHAAGTFTYVAPPPAVSGVSPSSGPATGGTTVTISGTGLAGATAVHFGSASATISSDSATKITVTSPAVDATGAVSVTVTTPVGTSAAATFTYLAPPPSVTGLKPNSGSTEGGTTVTIVGSNLAGATSVSFGGAAATIVSDGAEEITVTSPAGQGAVSVTVTTPSGTSSGATFTYVSPIE
jgi:eukaryotic-like serine/threonine-protein kinase